MTTGSTKRVPSRVVLGYSAAGFGMGAAATAFYAFFLFFLTTVAGINPAVGGILILLAVLWDGITDPTLGYLSDRSRSKYGKRRPFILVAAVPFGVTTALMFTDVSFASETTKLVWVLGVNMAFWLFFTMADIPWAALGSEMTEDFDEKTRIRTASATLVQIGTFAAMAGFPILVGYGRDVYGTESSGWSFAGAMMGLVIVVMYFVSWSSTRGCETAAQAGSDAPAGHPSNVFGSVGSALRNKPMRYLLALTLLQVMAYSGVWAATLMFMLTFNLGVVDEGQQALYLAVWPLSAILFTPVLGAISRRFSGSLGKARTLGFASLATAAALLAIKLVGLTPTTMVLAMLACAIGHSAFWLFVYLLAYDVGTVETYLRGGDNDGVIVSVMSFTLKVGMALGLGLGGMLLDIYGFVEGATEQSARALAGIEAIFFYWGAALVAIGAMFCFHFPVTKEKYEALRRAIDRRAAGQPHSDAEFSDLL